VKVLFSYVYACIKCVIIYKRKISILAAFHNRVNYKVVLLFDTYHVNEGVRGSGGIAVRIFDLVSGRS
jgi:hypothetical protein